MIGGYLEISYHQFYLNYLTRPIVYLTGNYVINELQYIVCT